MRVMVVGLGHVGRALLRAWSRVRPGVRLVAACDSRGRYERAEGLDPADVVARKLRGEYDAPLETSAAKRIDAIHPDVLVELSPTDVATGEPAVGDMLTALRLGAHVVTS